MTTTLTYGQDTTCLLESTEAIQLQTRSQQPLSIDEIAATVVAQLEKPLDYPPLSQATIPGDHVVLAVGPGIPQQLAVIDGVLTALRNAGSEPTLISLVLSSPLTDVERLRTELADLGHDPGRIQVHDLDNEKESALLGVNHAGEAVRLNRQLCDADFVLPVGVTTVDVERTGDVERHAPPSSFGGLFPAFSNRETIARFSAAAADRDEKTSADHFQEIDACGRLLSVGMMLQVVPSPDGHVAAVCVGEPKRVARLADENYRQTWRCESALRGSLVIATLAGGADQQTWENVGRAIVAAESVLESDGTIAICSELAVPPGPALSQLMGNDDPLVIEREILRQPSADCIPAMHICRALQRGAVYLRSQLRPAVVESLGMTPLQSDSELQRLAQTLRPCLVLEEAQKLLPGIVEVEAGPA